MKSTWTIAVLVLLLTVGLASNLDLAEGQEFEKIAIASSIAPLSGIVSVVGGAFVENAIILPEGVEPHISQLTTEAVIAAQEADLLVFTGHFAWEMNLAEQVDTPFITLEEFGSLANYTSFGARLSPLPGDHDEEYDHEEEHGLADEDHDHHDGNPHGYWLLPINALAIANATRTALISLMPERISEWNSGFEIFLEKLEGFQGLVDSMDEDYGFSNLKAITVFPAEAYVAEAFGIETIAYLQEGSVQISGAELLVVQDALRNGTVQLILGSDVAKLQAAGAFANQLVQDYGGILVWVRAVFFEGLSDYIAVMSYNLGSLTAALNPSAIEEGNTVLVWLFGGTTVILGAVVVFQTFLLFKKSQQD